MTNIIDMVATGLSRSAMLANKDKQIYGLFYIFLFMVIVSCEVDTHPHILLTRANQYTQDINRHFYVTMNQFGAIVFA